MHAATTENYGYDGRGQITTTSATTTYSSSSAGLVTATPGGDQYTYDTAQQLSSASNTSLGTSATYAYSGAGDRTQTDLTSTSGTTTTTYGYDGRNNLDSVIGPGVVVVYSADGDGLRQSRIDSTTTRQFLWDTSSSLPLLLDDGAHSYIYGPSTTPLAQIDSSGTAEYLHADNVGSVRVITNGAGSVVSTDSYDAYGKSDGHSGTGSGAIGYTGNWTDPETGLVYLRARDYDPATTQFLQVDPAVDDTHYPYAYVEDAPLGVSDPTGLCASGDDWCNFLQQAQFFSEGLNSEIASQYYNELEGFGYAASGGSSLGIIEAISPGATCNIDTGGTSFQAGEIGGIGAWIVVDILEHGAAKPPTFGATRLAQDENVNPVAPEALPTNRSIGLSPTQNAQLQSDVARLEAEGATDIRVNQQQVNANGVRVGINRPDLQYTDANGVRHYDEYETPGSDRGPGHLKRIETNDPAGIANYEVVP